MRKKKKLQELTIRDNFMFGAVMVKEELCKEFLELVLGFPIEKVTVDKEKSIIYHPEYKGVRLDITAADEKRTHYNIEMQVRRKKKLGRRKRFYHSQIDVELLLAGREYEELPDSYVIFICDFDPFGKKKYCYTFEPRCREAPEVCLDDGSYTIFLSTRGKNRKEVPEGLVKFLKYVRAGLKESTGDFGDGFVERLQDAVRNVKKSREMEGRYMLFQELLNDERAEGKAEGKADAVLELLAELGEVPSELGRRIRKEKRLDVLSGYLKKAAVSKSIEEFETWIREAQS